MNHLYSKDLVHSMASIFLAASAILAVPAQAAEFGNKCTVSLANDNLVQTDCSIKTVYQGKEYCFGSEDSKAAFLKNPQATLVKAESFYAKNDSAGTMGKDSMDKAMPVQAMMAKEDEQPREKMTQQQALDQIKSTSCDLSNKDLGYLEFDNMDLRHCTMVNTSFFGAYLRGANLSGSNMQGAYLNLARLENTNLSGANLKDATIFQAIFDKTNFKGANLSNARMIGTLGNVDMSGANIVKGRFGLDIGNQPMGAMRFDAIGGNFANTNFEGADINRSNFKFADFTNANLRNTDLFRADLSKADLTGADITGANMKESILDGTIMANVKGLEATQGYDISKGKCVACTVSAQPISAQSVAAQGGELQDDGNIGEVKPHAAQEAARCVAAIKAK